MSRRDSVPLKQMLDYAREAVGLAAGKARSDLALTACSKSLARRPIAFPMNCKRRILKSPGIKSSVCATA